MVTTTQDIIIYRDIATLRLFERNYREGDVGAIVVSIERFGFNGALRVWQDGIVAAGNHALKALQSMKAGGYAVPRGVREVAGQWHAPCVDVSHLSQVEAEAFAVADNRTQELGLNDEQQLTELLQGIAAQDVDLLAATGYGADELDAMLAMLAAMAEPVADPGAQVDRSDELQQVWQVARGDVWQIGEHRLLCGDSTNADDVARLMDGERGDMVFTDPPYGMDLDVDYDSMFRADPSHRKTGERFEKVVGDDLDFDPRSIMAMFNDVDEQFWWGADYYADRIPNFTKGSLIVWDKRCSPEMDKVVGNIFELAWSKKPHRKEIARILWSGHHGMQQDDTDVRVHPTQKPSELVRWFFDRWGRNGDLIFDPFIGSGTTLVACEQTGRRGCGIEIEPKYCAVTLQRLQDMGLTPARVE